MNKSDFEILGKEIVEAAYAVHKELGPGLLESVYEYCMLEELREKELYVENQVVLPLMYKGKDTGKTFMVDLLVENEIILELKAVEKILPVHEVQLLTYMRLADKRLGFLINFNVPLIKEGIKRKVNRYFFES